MNSPNVIIIPDLEPTHTQRKLRIAGSVIGLALLIFGLYSCAAEEPATSNVEPAKEATSTASAPLRPTTLAELEAKVAPDAVSLMTREHYPKTFAKLGSRQFDVANDLTRWAALAAAEHGGMCDRVNLIDVSDRATRSSIVWFADCANGQRVMIDQEQAADVRKRFAGKGK